MSFEGTLGPFVQGPSRSRRLRLSVAASFAGAFVAAALGVFALAWTAGAALGAADLPLAWRRGLAAAALGAFAALDAAALHRSRYCPLGWRRQTPRRLMYRHGAVTVAAAWGFDAGLVVTTFRVAALTWGALAFAVLGLAPWWAGLGYGLAFAVPLTVLLFTHRAGRVAAAAEPADPGLESLLGRRGQVQMASLVLLGAAGVVLLLELLA